MLNVSLTTSLFLHLSSLCPCSVISLQSIVPSRVMSYLDLFLFSIASLVVEMENVITFTWATCASVKNLSPNDLEQYGLTRGAIDTPLNVLSMGWKPK